MLRTLPAWILLFAGGIAAAEDDPGEIAKRQAAAIRKKADQLYLDSVDPTDEIAKKSDGDWRRTCRFRGCSDCRCPRTSCSTI